ncbi:hypothetical protein B0J11DRAFT_132643 [Dendryphion nanum]|uniref:SET domain-containing protein n=1 Tax=Dendryphion nanum TaxID=256645 RepID=A0A9P9IB14_9PLEO|nr:hypothetical protein B0J11DRAFT_132643 [Dendryphion nanum]
MPSTVVIPSTTPPASRVLLDKVHSILSVRTKDGDEQYLVRWKTDLPTLSPPLSWHSISELARCLEYVQDYLDERAKFIATAPALVHLAKKRKSPDDDGEIERRPSPLERHLQQHDSRANSTSRSPSVSSATASGPAKVPTIDIYNGIIDSQDGFIVARKASSSTIHHINLQKIPTPSMLHTAQHSKIDKAERLIRAEYVRRLEKVPGKRIYLVNLHDSTTPSLRFRFISTSILREGVTRVDPMAQVGCTKCSPHMGRDIGCEYTKKCDCLEYAAVDESRLSETEKIQLYDIRLNGGSTMGLPKKFPYYAEGTKVRREGTLVPFYANSRHPIYECNDKCGCGPRCRNKNVQFGRRVELEIFKTASNRGWGLRCRQDLFEGQFVDTYRGEIITDAEATRRENSASSKAKASYLYSLDKFAESEGLADEDVYVVDGEFMGGPSKFMNHSCEPNCRQYTVSYNKHDCRVYEIAFFAYRDIRAGEELTFDYLDKEEEDDDGGIGEEEEEEPSEEAIPCLCGAKKCRRWLWT